MIYSKKDLANCLSQDAIANKRRSIRPALYGDDVWKFIYLLRLNEYYSSLNGIKRILHLPMIILRKIQFHHRSILMGFSIPVNVFDAGISIAHHGTIVVNGNCKIGKNCRIQTGVTLGSTNGCAEAPVLGDNVFLGDGCKIIGNITIANDVAIGANAVVVKSIMEPGTTWGGIPAHKISNNNSHSNLSQTLFL